MKNFAILEYDTLIASKKKVAFVPKKQPVNAWKKKGTDLAAFDDSDIHMHQSNGRTYTSPWKPGFKMYANAKPPCNVCKEDSHCMTTCGKLWLKIYGHLSAEQLKTNNTVRPDFVDKYVETCDPESLAALDFMTPEELYFMADYEVLDDDPEAVLQEDASWDDYDSFFECLE